LGIRPVNGSGSFAEVDQGTNLRADARIVDFLRHSARLRKMFEADHLEHLPNYVNLLTGALATRGIPWRRIKRYCPDRHVPRME